MSDFVGVNGFVWTMDLIDIDGRVIDSVQQHNLIPAAGMAHLVRSPFGDVSPISTFYLGVFRGDYIPTESTSAADIPGNMIEIVDYSESQRPLWDRQFDGGSSMDNVDQKARITFTQDAMVRGMFLVSEPTKGGNSGLLLSCVRFATPKQVSAGQGVDLSGGLTYISTNVI